LAVDLFCQVIAFFDERFEKTFIGGKLTKTLLEVVTQVCKCNTRGNCSQNVHRSRISWEVEV
jgi:hypothetical protein